MKNGVWRPPSSLVRTYTCDLNFVCGCIVPGFARTWPLSTSVLWTPLNNTPILSPASAWSNNFLNISTPVTTVFVEGLIPTISTSSCNLTSPLSTLPVTTVPLPVIVITSSIGIKNGWSIGLSGVGM